MKSARHSWPVGGYRLIHSIWDFIHVLGANSIIKHFSPVSQYMVNKISPYLKRDHSSLVTDQGNNYCYISFYRLIRASRYYFLTYESSKTTEHLHQWQSIIFPEVREWDYKQAINTRPCGWYSTGVLYLLTLLMIGHVTPLIY